MFMVPSNLPDLTKKARPFLEGTVYLQNHKIVRDSVRF